MCGLTPHSAKSLAKALVTNKHLEELDISGNTLLGDDGIQCLALALRVNQRLKVLDLQKCSITSISESFAEALAVNRHLEKLNISGNALQNNSIEHLAHVLGVNQCLKKLHLQECSITSISELFAQALASNKHLEELDISGNALDGDGIQYLAQALRVNRALRILKLKTCGLISQSSKSLVEALTTNTHLKELNISTNALQNDIIKHLSHVIGVNQCLNKLHLQKCSITSISEGFAAALANNKHLEELDISGNALGGDGIQYLAQALRVNRGLRILSLKTCSLTSLSAKSIAEALTTNTHLEELNTTDNALCDDGIQYLARALKVNQHLKRITLASCGVSDIGLRYLAKAIQDNHSLKSLIVTNPYSKIKSSIAEKIVPVLIECLQNNDTLTNLLLPRRLESSVSGINEAVNDVRKRNGLPVIDIIY